MVVIVEALEANNDAKGEKGKRRETTTKWAKRDNWESQWTRASDLHLIPMQDNVEGGLLAKNYCIKVTCVVLFVIAPIITREDYAFFLAK